MAQPIELIVGPLTLWTAPVGEAFTVIDVAPAGNWVKVGSSGDEDYTDDGVVVLAPQTVEFFRGAGNTGPRKAYITEEDLIVRVTVANMTLEEVNLAFNSVAITTAAGPPAIKDITLNRGSVEPAQMALQVRGKSPYADAKNMQFEIPVAIHMGSPEFPFTKSAVTAFQLEFMALVDPSAATAAEKFGRLLAQTS